MKPAPQLSDYSVTIYKVAGEGTPWLYEIHNTLPNSRTRFERDLIRTGRADSLGQAAYFASIALREFVPSSSVADLV